HSRRVKLARPRFKGDWLALKPGTELALTLGLTRAALELSASAGAPAEVAKALADLGASLAAWTPERTESETGGPPAAAAAAARRMREAGRKALLFGRGVLEHPQAAELLQAIENLAWALGAITRDASAVMAFGAHHDSAGALEMGLLPDAGPGFAGVSARGLPAREALAAAAAGKVRALWI